MEYVQSLPVGAIVDFAGANAPAGWLLCYGQAISRTIYAALFAELSTTYGAGNGTTTFNLPDLRGRVVAGQDDMGGSSANRLTGLSGGVDGDTLAATGGAETHTLDATEVAAHSHLIPTSNAGGGGTFRVLDPGGIDDGGISAQTLPTNNSTGGGGAHNNVQPTIILNKIIKY